ncbi:hypothetical protein PVAP13_2NG336036 [Panicum virgatum]|uniref:Uncharacterized protein n=1 Tax=Panicum virgatum TaxID=38727 RepID=A0A8T0VFP5_PANVG|nr:hypothetical protein PVAP13_2NG336036 [Panicum virgatum]
MHAGASSTHAGNYSYATDTETPAAAWHTNPTRTRRRSPRHHVAAQRAGSPTTHPPLPSLATVARRGSSLPVEGLLEGLQVLGLEREEHVDGVVLVGALRHVRGAAAEHLRRRHEPRAAPPEVGVVDGHPQPADHPQVRLRHELPARRLAALLRLQLQVVHHGAHEGVVHARHRAPDPLRHEPQRPRQHVAHARGHQVPHDRVPEVGRRQRRAEALADVGRHAEPRVGAGGEAPGDAHGAPQVRGHRAEGGRPRRAPRPDARQELRRDGVGARHEGPRRAAEVARGVDRVVEGGARRGARPEEGPVVERRRRRGRGLPARQRRPRPDELERAGAVHRHVVHARAHRDAAALEEGDLQREFDVDQYPRLQTHLLITGGSRRRFVVP